MLTSRVIVLLSRSKPHLQGQFGGVGLTPFRSTVRGVAFESSDVDVLVTFDGPATSYRYFGVQFYLEDLLGRPVDLVTDKALCSEVVPCIKRELVSV